LVAGDAPGRAHGANSGSAGATRAETCIRAGSEDPPYFGATIGGECALCAEHWGFDDAALIDVTRAGIDAGFFCEGSLKATLRAPVSVRRSV
jgi:hypothetical protein